MDTRDVPDHWQKPLVTVSLDHGLAQARQRQGLAIESVAERLKITTAYVSALEQGAFEQLPARPFVRGYLKNYGRLLGVDVEEALRDYDAYLLHTNEVTPAGICATGYRRRKSRWSLFMRYGATLLTVLLAVALSYYGWQRHYVESIAETSLVDRPLGSASTVAALTGSAGTEPSNWVNLFIRFQEDCWVEIKSSVGTVILSDLKRAGDELSIQVPPTIQLKLGNTPSVAELRFAGQAIATKTQPTGNRVSQLMLNLDQLETARN